MDHILILVVGAFALLLFIIARLVARIFVLNEQIDRMETMLTKLRKLYED
jgi:hypothetical protein